MLESGTKENWRNIVGQAEPVDEKDARSQLKMLIIPLPPQMLPDPEFLRQFVFFKNHSMYLPHPIPDTLQPARISAHYS